MLNGLICQKCGSKRPDPKYMKDDFYVCLDCGHVIGYDCPGCQHFYEDNQLVFYQDRYICKRCGQPQWGYTAWKK